jgi:hypothetical protein
MPSISQITAASTTLTAIGRAQIISLIRGSSRYQSQIGLYPDLEAKLDAATTIQIQQLNASLALLDIVGDGTVALEGGEDAVNYDQVRDREQLINYMIDTLFISPVVRAGIGVASMNRIRQSLCSRCGCLSYSCHC